MLLFRYMLQLVAVKKKVCDYSRIKEGYCFEILKDIPASVECPKELKTTDGKCEELKTKNNNGEETAEQKVRRFLCEDLLMPLS